jgi:hypothetical protein
VECTTRALNIGSKENTPDLESITLSDSDYDERPKKKAKTLSGSGTPSMSGLHEFEQEKAKWIARNKKLLLETIG